VSSPRYRRLAARGTAVGILLAVVVVVIVFVMVAKPA
jgi:tetrahydromethanopterin S-methyltransferase subunit F